MQKLHTGMGVLLGGLLFLTLGAQRAPAADPRPPTVVVGTFDSRAVAIAYIRSAAAADYLRAQKADVERVLGRARAAGDRELVAALDAVGPGMQERIHRQGFGTAPIDDILARIEQRLPALAEAAGVDVIVSKWALSYRAPGAQFVDVTDPLAAAFEPDAETWKVIHSIVATEPMAPDQLAEDH